MTVTPITKLELRSEPIPRGPIIVRLEQEIGRALTYETRHYLAGRPAHCGDTLELYLNGGWISGRYEWTGKRDELPTFDYEGEIMRIDDECLVRWPI